MQPSPEALTAAQQGRAIDLGAAQLASRFDARLGGFGGAPKFPRPAEINLLLHQHARLVATGDEEEAGASVDAACSVACSLARACGQQAALHSPSAAASPPLLSPTTTLQPRCFTWPRTRCSAWRREGCTTTLAEASTATAVRGWSRTPALLLSCRLPAAACCGEAGPAALASACRQAPLPPAATGSLTSLCPSPLSSCCSGRALARAAL